jgi:hypothetical protein
MATEVDETPEVVPEVPTTCCKHCKQALTEDRVKQCKQRKEPLRDQACELAERAMLTDSKKQGCADRVAKLRVDDPARFGKSFFCSLLYIVC